MTRDDADRASRGESKSETAGALPADSVLIAKARAKARRDEARKLARAKDEKPGTAKSKKSSRKERTNTEVPESVVTAATSDAATETSRPAEVPLADLPSADLREEALFLLLLGAHRTPHAILGAHEVRSGDERGVIVRALIPADVRVSVVTGGLGDADALPMRDHGNGLHTLFLAGQTMPFRYRLRIGQPDGSTVDRDDPYRFMPTVGEIDLHLFGEGRHLRLWEKLGAHPRVIDDVAGTSFAVWAPNATRVSLIGSFNAWDSRVHPMRALGTSGVWELFVPAVGADALYKFEIKSNTGAIRVKTDPMAFQIEQTEGHASIVMAARRHQWNDGEWMAARAECDPVREPMLVYEVHLASWARVPEDNNRSLTYREIAPRLAAHVKQLGFTHVELLPILEHPFGGSWGYQVSNYYAPTSRHGTPDDFRYFVDTMHANGIGVLLDWVPAHFPKDDWALRRFDGTACYEHEDPRLGEHPEWGTLIFNYGRHEVRNFLLANALYWIEEFHIDGLRVDAVASMLYLDYGREAGQWMRNRFGGRENLDAVSFLKQLNYTVLQLHRGVSMIAEESTTWPRVTHPIVEGGLGFTFKWNMGWMHDTLDYFRVDPFFRKGAHDKLTFAMMYEYSEHFVNPLSHDEVVHLKKSLLDKMPGDAWQKLANLRALIGYSITRPGKSLFFMGAELGVFREWNHDASLDWHLLNDPARKGLMDFVSALGALYREHPCFWRRDAEPSGFSWIDVGDKEQSVLSFTRWDGNAHALVILNLTPVPRDGYRVGAPASGTYRLALSSDEARFGGSGHAVAAEVSTDAIPFHGFTNSIAISLPPLSITILRPDASTEIAEGRDDQNWTALDVTRASDIVVPVPSTTDKSKRPKRKSKAKTDA
ncbi:MAG: 1,4-alpha-glucan branching protein GlgB [Gemmatimonas sp.]